MKAEKIASRAILILSLFCASEATAASRIVALTPAITDLLLEILPARRHVEIVGTSQFARLPGHLKVPEVASAGNVEIEALARLSPTVVIDSPGAAHEARLSAAGKMLRHRGARIEVVPIQSLRDVVQAYRTVGNLVGEQARGEELAREFESALSGLAGGASSAGTSFFQVDGEPLMAVGGGNDFLVELLARMGVKNAFSRLNHPYSVVSEESVVAANPDWIVVLGLSGERAKFLQMASRWRLRHPALKAVREGRVCVLDADQLTRPSRAMVDGARELIRLYQGKSCRD